MSILNPKHEKTDIRIIFYKPSGPAEYRTDIAAQSVKLIKMEELEIVPKSQRYGVGVKSTLPIVVQQTRRSLVKGGTPSSKSIFAAMAVPLRR